MRVRARSFLYLCLRIFFRRFLTTLLISLLPSVHCRSCRRQPSCPRSSAPSHRHPRNDHHRSRLKTLHRRIRCHQRGLPIASSRGAGTCSGFPWRIRMIPGCPGTGHERKEVALTPVGEDVLLRPGCDVCKARPSRRRCIFERSRTIKSSSFCRSTAGTDRFPCRPSTTTASVQGPSAIFAYGLARFYGDAVYSWPIYRYARELVLEGRDACPAAKRR